MIRQVLAIGVDEDQRVGRVVDGASDLLKNIADLTARKRLKRDEIVG